MLSETDIRLSEADVRKPVTNLDPGIGCCVGKVRVPPGPTFDDADLESLPDPVRTKCVTGAICLALKHEKRRKLMMKRKGHLVTRKAPRPRPCVLPMEILYMILRYLPYQTIANVEKGLRLNLGNRFWRTWLSSRMFYEVRDIAIDEVNWKRLSMLLERRLKKSNALAIRRFLLASLDNVMRFVNM